MASVLPVGQKKIDGATHDVGPVQQRGCAFGDADLRKIKGSEATRVHIAVVGHVKRDAVQEHRYLARIEAAQVHHFFVARIARDADTRQHLDGLAHGVQVVALELAAAQDLFVLQHVGLLALDYHVAQCA